VPEAVEEHSPPTRSASTIATVSPPATMRSATFSPTGPAPRTTTSYSFAAIGRPPQAQRGHGVDPWRAASAVDPVPLLVDARRRLRHAVDHDPS
jgi:hypothetical protein